MMLSDFQLWGWKDWRRFGDDTGKWSARIPAVGRCNVKSPAIKRRFRSGTDLQPGADGRACNAASPQTPAELRDHQWTCSGR